MITQENLRAARLWAAAEGRADANGRKPTRQERARAQFALAESVASGEFPTQILPAVRRTLQAVFDTIPQVAEQFTTRTTVAAIDVDEQYNVYSFGDQTNMQGTSMGDTFVNGGLPTLGPREKYPQLGLTASGKTVRASKIGEAFGMDWEAIVRTKGTQINILRDAFTAFGRHAGNQQEIDVAKKLVKSSGFATASGEGLNTATPATGSTFSTSNPDLYIPTDIPAAIALSNAAVLTVGTGGTVSTIIPNYTRYVLLCTPENAPRLRQVLAARRITRVPASTSAGTEWEETIDLGAEIEVIGWRWLKTIWPSMGKGWILVPVAEGDDLPVLTSNFLEGYETPSTWIKDSNARQIGGGEVNPQVDGDFDSDAVETKVRHVHGASALWVNGVVYSTGANA